MTAHINKYILEGIDRTGKSSLVAGIQNARGYHATLHFSKPIALNCYGGSLLEYQVRSFRTMFSILRDAKYSNFIFDRGHLGEAVYGPLYRQTDGDYVFELEKAFDMHQNHSTRLILLTEDFSISKHFVDDGESFDITKREQEQEMFIAAFERSTISDKRIVCVTDSALGGFKPKDVILQEVLA